jgi:cytochrome c
MTAIAQAARTIVMTTVLGGALGAVLVPDARAAAGGSGNQGFALARQYNCMACHSVSHRLLAPPFRDIAARYKGQSNALTHLQRKIIDGGAGAWGTVPMPPNTQITDEQAAILARWILNLH